MTKFVKMTPEKAQEVRDAANRVRAFLSEDMRGSCKEVVFQRNLSKLYVADLELMLSVSDGAES